MLMMICSCDRIPVYSLVAILVLIQGCYSCNYTIVNTIRLNNEGVFSSTDEAGRVEICHCSDISSCDWQTVSTGSRTNPFSWKNSIVVCRELNFFDVQSPILQNTVLDINHADDSVPVYATTFDCDGSESSLIDCSSGEGTGSQTHNSDAYVTCQSTPADRKVRIVGSTDPTEGIIEIYTTAAGWNTVCTDFWRNIEANVFCESLGYSGGVSNSYPRSNFINTAVNSQSTINILSCSTTDTSMNGCSIAYSTDCGDFISLAGARCTSPNVADGDVRLYDIGATTFSRVEVFFAGRWGTVCDTAWVIETGQVACRELGSTPSLTQIPSSISLTFYPTSPSSRPIWIFGYTCDGDESNLHDCSRPVFPIGFIGSSCSHSSDAGLYCEKAPYQLSGGGIAGIVIASLFVVGLVITLLILNDKYKKGELQAWYRPRRARFLTWYHQRRRQWQTFRRSYCSCCTCRRCHRQHPQPSGHQDDTRDVISNPVTTSTPQQQQSSSTQAPSATVEPTQLSAVFTATAPPSYDAAINEHQVPPPPDYSTNKLPYPETDEHPAAYPPPGAAAGMH